MKKLKRKKEEKKDYQTCIYQNVNNVGFLFPSLGFSSCLTINIYYLSHQKIKCCLKISGLKILKKIKRNYVLTFTRGDSDHALHMATLYKL